MLVQAKPGDVLLVAEGISKTYDGEKQLFGASCGVGTVLPQLHSWPNALVAVYL